MGRLFRWIRTNVLYGIAALIPVAALLLIAWYLYGFWTSVLTPITSYFGLEDLDSQLTAVLLSLGALVVISFAIGLVVRTRFGSWTFDKLEERVLVHIPGHGTISTLLRGFADDNHAYPAARATLSPGGAAVLCFVMEDDGDGYLTVFVPSAPVMTVGQIYLVARDHVEFLPDASAEVASAVSRWGVGMKQAVAIGRNHTAAVVDAASQPTAGTLAPGEPDDRG